MNSTPVKTKWSQFISLIVVFFFWGFVAASNDILIPVFKKYFVLSQVESQLVAWAFYAAYFIGSVIFFLISLKSDVLQRFGYKKTLACGLAISAIGAFLFVPAAASANFWFFLLALFTVGLGFSVQQIVANPLAIKMGSADTGAHRLTLAGGINSLGTTIGPIIVGIALFGMGNFENTPKNEQLTKTQIVENNFSELEKELQANKQELIILKAADRTAVQKSVSSIDKNILEISKDLSELKTAKVNELEKHVKRFDEVKKSSAAIIYPKEFVQLHLDLVKKPFIILGIAFLLAGVFMLFAKIDDPAKEEDEKIDAGSEKFNIFKYPQLSLGMLGIFLYVGVEVSIISNLPALLHTAEFGNVLENNIAPFISLYWGSLMIGRWNGGINVFKLSPVGNILLKFIVPFIAFAVILGANYLSGKDVTAFYIYPIWIIIFIIMSFWGGKNAGKTLMLFGLAGIVMMLMGLMWPDKEVAVYFFISGGLFCSIMWPAIFDLAIAGLGKNTGKASSFLIMMILGGGIIPLVQGYICDFDLSHPGGIFGITFTHFSYIIPVFCFLYLTYYGYIAPKILKKQGISLTAEEGSAH